MAPAIIGSSSAYPLLGAISADGCWELRARYEGKQEQLLIRVSDSSPVASNL